MKTSELKPKARVLWVQMGWKGEIIEVQDQVRVRWDDKPWGEETTGTFSKNAAMKELVPAR